MPATWDPVSEAGQRARGLYLGSSYVRRNGVDGVLSALRRANMNAVVLDLKDADGRVHYDTAIAELESGETGNLGDARAMVQALRAEGIYTIARVVCFADRRLPAMDRTRAIQHVNARRHPTWVSWGTGGTWLDPYNPENHQLVVSVAQEVAALGFDEIQLDYVRFPVDDGIEFAVYPSLTEESHAEVLMRLLSAVDAAIDVPLAVDVFGLAAYRRGDPSGLGQDLEAWTEHVEVFTPMLYVNSMRAWRRGQPRRAFNLVYNGIRALRGRLGPNAVIRPFLQAFERGADDYGPRFIADQIRANQRGRGDGFLFWHPGLSYGMVQRAMVGRRRALARVRIDEEVVERRSRRAANAPTANTPTANAPASSIRSTSSGQPPTRAAGRSRPALIGARRPARSTAPSSRPAHH